MKIKSIHFINIPRLMDKIMSLIRPFLKKELLDNIHIHQPGSGTIKSIIPIENLPKELGGNYKTIEEIQSEVLFYFYMNKKKNQTSGHRWF